MIEGVEIRWNLIRSRAHPDAETVARNVSNGSGSTLRSQIQGSL